MNNKIKIFISTSFVIVMIFVGVKSLFNNKENTLTNNESNTFSLEINSDLEESFSSSDLSENKFSYECFLNDKKLKLPCSILDLENCGYCLSENGSKYIGIWF